MLLKLKSISKKHEYLLKGQGHRHRNCTCKILSLCMPADFWHLLLHRYFICSNHQQLLSFSIHTSFLMQKLCREQPQQHLSDLRLTQPLLDLIAATMGNLQRWLTNTGSLSLKYYQEDSRVKTIMTQPCTESSKSTVYFLLMIFYYFMPVYFAKLTRLWEGSVLGVLLFATKQLLMSGAPLWALSALQASTESWQRDTSGVHGTDYKPEHWLRATNPTE